MRLIAIVVSLASLFVLITSGAAGQSVLVEVVAAESSSPLPGVFISLIDGEDRVVRSALTDDAGRAVFPLGAAGLFRVRAELIGRRTAVSEPFGRVRADSTTAVRLALSAHAVALDEIRVQTTQRCRLRPDEASEIARVWDEARKALSVQAWTERERFYRLDLSMYERDLDGQGRTVEREARRATSGVTRVPFESLPAEDLVRAGFVRPLDDGGHQYYAPDARLLLSDLFLDTHCFRLTRSRDQPGAIGLAFEPARSGPTADIRGVLWVDEATAALRFIEYWYTWAPAPEAEGLAGGRVDFGVLPDGAWIIEKWWIRAPILARHPGLVRRDDPGIRVAAIRETGGEVVAVSTRDRRRITQARRGSVRGVVWDSTTSSPLPGATVHLSGTGYRGTTDDDGRFLLEDVPAGVFTGSFAHPRLDSLGVVPAGTEARVLPGQTTEIRLAVPSLATVLLAACAAAEPEVNRSALSGVVRDGATGEPIPGASVRVEWQEVERLQPLVLARDRWFEVGADAAGRYTACGVPTGEAVSVRAALLTARGAAVVVELSEVGHRTVDLEIELPRARTPAGVASGADTEFGVQGVQGLLVERESRSAIRFAEVTVRRVSEEAVATGLTDERGFFRLRTPVPGRFLLSARALGYRPVSGEPVDVSRGNLSVLEVSMAPEALALDPIVVVGQPRAFQLELEGFYRRQAEGFGAFLPPEVFERRQPRRVSDLLFGLPGTYVAEPSTGAGGRAVYFRSGIRPSTSGGLNVCWPMVYVDRHLVSTGGLPAAGGEPTATDDLVNAPDVWAMEVYRSPAEVPPEFNGPNAGCGVIVLWTRRGGGD